MHRSRPQRAALTALALSLCLAWTPAASAQDGGEEPAPTRRLVVEPAELVLDVGEKAQLDAKVLDAEGAVLEAELFYFSRARRSVTVSAEGEVEAVQPGHYTLVVRERRNAAGEGQESREDEDGERPERLSVRVPVTVKQLPVADLVLTAPPALFADTVVPIDARALDGRGVEREADIRLTSGAPDVVTVDAFGKLHLRAPGRCTVTATSEGVERSLELEVQANPVSSVALELSKETARTGDVVRFTAVPLALGGSAWHDVPVEVSVRAELDDDLGPRASGQVRRDEATPGLWRFVAEQPGLYTLVATCGRHHARASLRVEPREYSTEIELVGRGSVPEYHTSDLWVWEGVDGRDYCVTGTWGADGEALFWDVTDPGDIERISRVQVDARTVNDVKVSADGRLCIISREGASNRKNGIVLIDVVDPRNPEVICEYTEGLTGGVHNLFIYEEHVYALSNGRRYDIIHIADPKNPRTVGSYELDTPGHSIHDVWVVDGLAYSSNWADGVHIVDVGNGVKGGSPENPVYVGSYKYPSGWNHAAFPYHNEKTGRTYVIAGDEAFPFGLNLTEKPTYARGWLHFIDITDIENPVEIARYEVPEAGTHNYWIEDDVAYVGYYNGGFRVVDLSGELMGDLYRQGREMAAFIPDDPNGFVANAPMVWGPQPHKGHVFFSDWNSGLWAVKVVEETGE